MKHSIRIWDLPTRCFHWSLALLTIVAVVSAKMGHMDWHLRAAYALMALLLFRWVWGLVGGRWSRFVHFVRGPGTILRYLRGQLPEHEAPGHNPLGALSVIALLLIMSLQVLSGLLSDDAIFFSGPLTRYAPGEWVELATRYHADIGQYLIYGLVGLHLAAIGYYRLVKRQRLVRAMVVGDKALPAQTPPSRDSAGSRIAALVLLTLCGGLAWWVSTL